MRKFKIGLSLLGFVALGFSCPKADVVQKRLNEFGLNYKVLNITYYKNLNLCSVDLKIDDKILKNAFLLSPDGKYFLPAKVGRLIEVKSPIEGWTALYVVNKNKKVLLGIVNKDGLYIPNFYLFEKESSKEIKEHK